MDGMVVSASQNSECTFRRNIVKMTEQHVNFSKIKTKIEVDQLNQDEDN